MNRRLFALSGCPFAHRVLIALREKGLEFELVLYSRSQRPAELNALGSRAKSPTLLDGDAAVFDSMVVLEYLEDRYPEPHLLPIEPLARARVRMCIARAADELVSRFNAVEHEAERAAGRNESAVTEKLRAFADALPYWNEHFEHRSYAVDEQFSLADVVLYTVFPALSHLIDWQLPKQYPHLEAWLERVQARPSSTPARA